VLCDLLLSQNSDITKLLSTLSSSFRRIAPLDYSSKQLSRRHKLCLIWPERVPKRWARWLAQTVSSAKSSRVR